MTETHSVKSITNQLHKPITLIGMMGSGKSTLGAAIASALGWDFYDTDKVIEAETKKTVPEIFAQDGEAAFRKLERDTVERLLRSAKPAVIATGGGSVTVPETADMIFGKSLCLWIDAPLEMLVARTARQKNRPLLKNGDPAEILGNLLQKRIDIYRRANLRIETDEGPVARVRERSLRQIADYLIEQTS